MSLNDDLDKKIIPFDANRGRKPAIAKMLASLDFPTSPPRVQLSQRAPIRALRSASWGSPASTTHFTTSC